MTLIQPAGPTGPTLQAHPPIARSGDFRARVLQEGLRAQLDELLHAVVLNALGPDASVAVPHEEWVRVEDAIRMPVAAATSAALERLATDVEAALPGERPVLVRRLADHRIRAELGYD